MTDPVRLTVISTSRSDLGILAPLVITAREQARFAVDLIVCGMHLQEGTPSDEELTSLGGIRLPHASDSLGQVNQFALRDRLLQSRCEVAFILGDRVELLEVALAGVHARVVLAHCAGGERTLGAWDAQIRDAMTKMAHLHYPTHTDAVIRLQSLAEETWRIGMFGQPSLDAIRIEPKMEMRELATAIGARPMASDVVVAIHPVTRFPEETRSLCELMPALENLCEGCIFLSLPNGDPGSDIIRATWHALSRQSSRFQVLPNRGARVFRAVVRACSVMLGNSSAALVEAPSLGAPSIDIGRRQMGRMRGLSVISCPDITIEALRQAFLESRTQERRSQAVSGRNPYGNGHACQRILDHLCDHVRRSDIFLKA
jgi:UDP-hydrolysing UDP-N-acetyl-D-glucosamine 2-epimerase